MVMPIGIIQISELYFCLVLTVVCQLAPSKSPPVGETLKIFTIIKSIQISVVFFAWVLTMICQLAPSKSPSKAVLMDPIGETLKSSCDYKIYSNIGSIFRFGADGGLSVSPPPLNLPPKESSWTR